MGFSNRGTRKGRDKGKKNGYTCVCVLSAVVKKERRIGALSIGK